MRPVLTRLAGLAVLVTALAAAWWPFWLSLLMTAIGAQRPDPEVPVGDPCCGHPDTWGEAAEYLAFGALSGVSALGLVVVAAAGVVGVVEGRAPRWIRHRWTSRLGAIWAVATLALAGILLAG